MLFLGTIEISMEVVSQCIYRNADMKYLEGMCDLIDKISDENKELFMLGDLNIDYFSISCHLRKKLLSVANACNPTQVVNLATRVFTNRAGVKSSTCIDHIFTNVPEHCSNAISLLIGFSDHNLVAIKRKIKMPKAGNKITLRRSFRRFNQDLYIMDVKDERWSDVCKEKDPESALNMFMEKLTKLADKHTPLRKTYCKA